MKPIYSKYITLLLIAALLIQISPVSFERIANAKGNREEQTYIIKFKDVEKGKKSLQNKKKKIKHRYSHLSLLSTALTTEEAQAFLKDSNVAYIEKDQLIEKTADYVSPDLTQIHVEGAQQLGLSGAGVKVAIMDTGINTQIPDLHVIDGASFVPSETSYNDTNGHGTMVAGILAAAKDDQGLLGVAPEVDLYSLKVLDKNGSGTYSQVIEALDWAIDHQINIVSMSFGGKVFSSALQEAMQKAHDSGILLLAATGNDGNNEVSYPAKFSTVIAVGAVDAQNQHASFSNTGNEVELVAPGVNLSCLSIGGQLVNASGTSLAVPHAAGVAALVKQNHPDYTNEEIRQVLASTADVLGSADQYGYGLVNAAASVQSNTIPGENTSHLGQNEPSNQQMDDLVSLYGVTQQFIQEQLEKGYTLANVAAALQYQQDNGGSFSNALDKVCPVAINNSNKAKSEIISDYGNGVVDTTPDQAFVTAAEVSEETLNNITVRPSEAPYSVQIDNESVSTLSGDLSFTYTDFTLPGRGGMSFSLTRSYNSNSAQFYEPDPTNTTLMPYDEKLFPIGKGWSWNIPSIESKNGTKYLHLGSGGTYQINGSTLVGYPWQNITYAADTSVTVNGSTSTNVLKSLDDGIKQYFNASGQLLQISDYYNNNAIKFNYTQNATYGRPLLSSITDAIGNTLSISYTTTNTIISYGNKSITLNKTSQNGKELLTSAIDALGRTTTFNYKIATASYNLVGTTPNTSDPYALITSIVHPTGAASIYTYETNAVTRYVGVTSVEQAYRMQSRLDQVTYADQSKSSFRGQNYTYIGDIGSQYGVGFTFSTIRNDSRTATTFTIKEQYVNATTPVMYYNTTVTTVSGNLTRTSTMTYDEIHRYPTPITTTMQTKNTQTLAVTPLVTTSRTVDVYGHVLTSINALGDTVTNIYDPTSHWLIATSKPVSETQTQYISYDRSITGNPKITQTTVKENNASGPILSQMGYENYDAYGNPQTLRILDTGRDVIVQLQYSAMFFNAFPTKQTIQITNVDNSTSTITRDYQYFTDTGLLKQYTDGNLKSTSYQYDKLGRIKLTTYPNLKTVAVDYNDAQNSYTVSDQTNVQQVTTYTPLGWQSETYVVDGSNKYNYSKTSYDYYGRVANVANTIGSATFGYDTWDRQITTTTADGGITKVQYDDINNTKTMVDAENATYRETYDKVGRLLKKEEVYADPTKTKTLGSYTYDKQNNLLTITDGQGYVTTYGYNTLEQLTSVLDAKQEMTSYAYSLKGDLKQITYPDNSTLRKDYDELGRLIQTTDQKLKKESYYYDANDNLTKFIDRNNQTTTYDYNSMNWLWHKKISDDTITFEYDDAGRRLSIENQTGKTSYLYDPKTGNLNTVTLPDMLTIGYQYDIQGRRKQMTDPFGQILYYSYNNMDELTGVSVVKVPTSADYEAQYQYYKNGLVKQIQQKNGITSSFVYDDGRLTNLTHKQTDGRVLNSYAYTYDTNSNIQAKNENEKISSFTYDQLNRISTSDQFTDTYSYDNRGNRLTYENNKNFDISDATYGYDKQNRLSTVSTTDGKNVSYKYNGDGLLYERTEEGITTRFYYDGANIIAEANIVNGIPQLKARYIRGGSDLIARKDAQGNSVYYLKNGHSDVVELRDGNGMKLNSYNYDIWGNPITVDEEVENPFGYSGEYKDEATSLQYLRSRWYDPSMGRFINEDTYEGEVDNPLTLNLYTYVGNNPLIFSDPSGNKKASDNEELGILLSDLNAQAQTTMENKNALLQAMQSCSTTTLCQNAQARYNQYAPIYRDQLTNIEKQADAIRVSYYKAAGSSLPNDVTYRNKGVEATEITQQLNGIMLAAEYKYVISDDLANNPANALMNFYYTVRNGAELDLKNQGFKSKYYIYNGHLLRGDAPGNIAFGYLGAAYGFSNDLLLRSAGAAQILAGTSNTSLFSSSHGDDPVDQYYILFGVNVYNNYHK